MKGLDTCNHLITEKLALRLKASINISGGDHPGVAI
jgi:hypothetical protein